MNKLMKFGSLMAITFAATAFTSCGDDTPVDTITEQSFLKCYAVVTDKQEFSQTISNPVTIKLRLNWTKATAEATITGLADYPMITISDMSWHIDEDWGEIDDDMVTAVINATGKTITISDFEMKWLDRLDFAEYVQEYDPALEYSFVIDNRYKIGGSRSPFIVTGKTVSTPENGDAYVYDKSIYHVQLDFANRKADISITGATFAQGMPALNIALPKIPFTVSEDGDIILAVDNLIPTLEGAPYDAFPISDVKAEIEPGDGMDLTFKCNFRGMTYTVVADLDFTSYLNAIG